MHAKHADKSEMNELSGWVIGCAYFIDLLDFGEPRMAIERVAHDAESSACFACIASLHLR